MSAITKLVFFIVVLLPFSISGCSPTVKKNTVAPDLAVPQYRFISSSGQTTGPLTIRSIKLMFQNNLGDITVSRDTPVQPETIIEFDGNGLFQAYWQVDGNDIEPVAINVTFGKTLKLRMLSVTQIPTFQPGQHRITLRITSPQTNLKIPVITYFVQM